MLKRYQYTCPDVVHMRKVNRNIMLANFGGALVMAAAMTVAGLYLEHQDKKDAARLKAVPDTE